MMIEVATIFSNTMWTFWDVMLFCFIWIPLVMLWAFCIADIFGRSDMSGWAKTAWLLFVLIIPWLGAVLYMLFRTVDQPYNGLL